MSCFASEELSSNTSAPQASMQSSKTVLVLTTVVTFFVLGTDGFVALSNSLPTSLTSSPSGTHVSSSIAKSSRCFTTHTSRPHEALMAAGGKKRRRRKENSKGSASVPSASTAPKPQPPSAAVPAPVEDSRSKAEQSSESGGTPAAVEGGADKLGDVLQGEKGLEALFTDDWSDMPANDGMLKSNVSRRHGGIVAAGGCVMI